MRKCGTDRLTFRVRMGPWMLKYLTLLILCAINLLNYMDRFTVAGILTLLQQSTNCTCLYNTCHYTAPNHQAGLGLPCRSDDCVSETSSSNRSNTSTSGKCWCCCGLGINDEQGGLLTTIFIVSYTFLSPVFGYFGDRYSRKKLIALGIFIWSGFTLAGSFFKVYWKFLLMRSFVGVGEASYGTIAPTIIADLFPVGQRMRMLSVFYLTTPFGSALGYIVGSGIASLFNCWQWAFRVTPVFGIILAVLCLCFVQEPPRGHSNANTESGLTGSTHSLKGVSGIRPFINDIIIIMKCKTFCWSTMGFSCMSFVVGALTQWAPNFIIWASKVAYGVHHGYTQKQANLGFGAITVATGVSGVVVGAELAKRWGRRNPKADALVCAIGMLACSPFLFFALLYAHRSPVIFWTLSVFAEFLLCLEWAPVAAILLYIVVPQRRSTAEAIQILFIHLLGDAFSPLVLGKISDTLRGTSHTPDVNKADADQAESEFFALQYASFITPFVAVLGGACFLIASFYLEEDRQAALQLIEIQDGGSRSPDRTAVNSGDDAGSQNWDESPKCKWDNESDQLLTGATCT